MKKVITFFLFLTCKVCLSSENIIEVSLNGEFKDLLSARDYIRTLREDVPKNTYIIEIIMYTMYLFLKPAQARNF